MKIPKNKNFVNSSKRRLMNIKFWQKTRKINVKDQELVTVLETFFL